MIDWAIAACGKAIVLPKSILNILSRPLKVPRNPKKANIAAMCINVFVNLWEREQIPQIRITKPNRVGMSAEMLIMPVAK